MHRASPSLNVRICCLRVCVCILGCSWYRKYTDMECARLCSKISNFYGKTCTHFSRQWINSKIPEHNDVCGRDGDTVPAGTPERGAWGSAGTGTGKYLFRGQCLFFNSPNNECCATKAAWNEEGTNTNSNHCQAKFGDRKDNWNSKHRSWRLKTQQFTPTEAWPVTSLGRRLSDEASNKKYDGESPDWHELFFPNGTRFWVEDAGEPLDEEPIPKDMMGDEKPSADAATENAAGRKLSAEEPLGVAAGVEAFDASVHQLLRAASDTWQAFWR